MTLLGLLHAVRPTEVVFAGGVVFALLLVGTTDANEGCGNTPDDSQMMSVLKQAADMFMPCIEGLYNMPVHGSILEEIHETLGACLVETTAEYLSTIKDFPYDPNVMAEKTLGCMMSSKTVPREKQRFFAALHWLLLLLK
ncbi:hypothetical protein HPB50_017661 [Hyalomma asiaticum]|uniref:Uncharacterized protein n=1 Tax=Hyalomma asiaticum TaxID=266040 RepID=A0ACB7SGL4_HYAAI|nr:hypothetical protein HPB50_017661 [Hyalomma asiaticum]